MRALADRLGLYFVRLQSPSFDETTKSKNGGWDHAHYQHRVVPYGRSNPVVPHGRSNPPIHHSTFAKPATVNLTGHSPPATPRSCSQIRNILCAHIRRNFVCRWCFQAQSSHTSIPLHHVVTIPVTRVRSLVSVITQANSTHVESGIQSASLMGDIPVQVLIPL